MRQVLLLLSIMYSLCDTDLPNPYLGNVYIADWMNNCIRKVSTGIITTIAGNRTYHYSGDNGQATSATLRYPVGVALDTSGTDLLILLVLLIYCAY